MHTCIKMCLSEILTATTCILFGEQTDIFTLPNFDLKGLLNFFGKGDNQ
jgi:hypothetical protein